MRSSVHDTDLRAWLTQIGTRLWKDPYVFFKHQESRSTPAFARRFRELSAAP